MSAISERAAEQELSAIVPLCPQCRSIFSAIANVYVGWSRKKILPNHGPSVVLAVELSRRTWFEQMRVAQQVLR